MYTYVYCLVFILSYYFVTISLLLLLLLLVLCAWAGILATLDFFQILHFLCYVRKILNFWNSLAQVRWDQRQYTSIYIQIILSPW